jgi:large subunit ribosomal protein L32
MAHPKRKTSKTRKAKRRTHYKAEEPTLSRCSATGTVHRRHTAYFHEGNLYYNGKLVIEKKENA